MLTDWVLIRRLARELEQRLRGARTDDAGLTADGRVAILFRRRGDALLLAVDLFASPPLVTVEHAELAIGIEPGFVRTLARSLRGMTLRAVNARRGDRLLRLTFTSRSRFGVGEQLDLYLELVPRFGNVVLVKDETIVAAHKEFAPSENPRRPVQAGGAYVLPPLPSRAGEIGPPPESEHEASNAPLFVYRRNGQLLQASVAPLERFAEAELSRSDSLLEIFAELRARNAVRTGNERSEARRRAIFKQLDKYERKLRAQLVTLDEKRKENERRESLRIEGEAIFATLHTRDEDEREAAKERAAALFAEYKRLARSGPHLEARERAVTGSLEAVDTLRWEAERAGDEDLGAVEVALAPLTPRRGASVAPAPPRRKRALLEYRTPHGSRILVGRSPIENAELTFRLARQHDLWFHAQRIPGAHVILARDDRGAPPDEDLRAAASLAAFYSRAKSASSVAVDYTPRKHVRKQRAAPPGLVWYTHATTIVVAPKSIESFR
jgi:predicted ribosome quality control (RQC) complex YloA/Tae2 family protein